MSVPCAALQRRAIFQFDSELISCSTYNVGNAFCRGEPCSPPNDNEVSSFWCDSHLEIISALAVLSTHNFGCHTEQGFASQNVSLWSHVRPWGAVPTALHAILPLKTCCNVNGCAPSPASNFTETCAFLLLLSQLDTPTGGSSSATS